MTPNEEKELMKKVRDMHVALVGDMTPDNPGALHMIQRHDEFIFSANNPKLGAQERLNTLEDEKKFRLGFVAACIAIGAFFGWLINIISGHK